LAGFDPGRVHHDRANVAPASRVQSKLLGIAVGNSDEPVEDFFEVCAVAFPVVSDRDFDLHRAVVGGPAPLSRYVLQGPE